MVKYCSECGVPNDDDSNFCIECGYKLEDILTPPQNFQKPLTVTDFKNDLLNAKVYFPTHESPILLKKNENVILYLKNIDLKEPKAIRKSLNNYLESNIKQSKDTPFKLTENSSRNISNDELKKIDSGFILLTNKRFIFIGNIQNVNVNLDNILAITDYIDGIAIQRENHNKIEYFIGTNKSKASFNRNGINYSFYFTGDVVKAAIMGRISKLY